MPEAANHNMIKIWKKRHVLIIAALLILFAFIGMTIFLLFSNYRNVALFKSAKSNFQRGDEKSLDLAEAQLLQLIRTDDDNENAYIMLSAIAGKRKIYPEMVYYSYMAHKLNPLSAANKAEYIKSLLFAREFERLENFLSLQSSLSDREKQILLYAAGRNKNFKKYPAQLERRSSDNKIGELALLLFKHEHLTIQEKLTALEFNFNRDDAFLQQELLADTHINGIPGKNFIFAIAADSVEILVNAAFVECVKPFGVIEILVPSIQLGTVFHSFLDDCTQPPVAPGKDSFETT